MPEKTEDSKIDKIEVQGTNIIAEKVEINGNGQKLPSSKLACLIFFSCEHTDNCNICSLFKETFCCYKRRIKAKFREQNRVAGFMNSQDIPDLKIAKEIMDSLNGDCLLVVNSHKPVNALIYFQIGYALAKGIDIIGLNDGKNEIVLPENIKNLIPITKDMDNFMQYIWIKIWKSSGFKIYEQGDGSGGMYANNSNNDRAFYCPDL